MSDTREKRSSLPKKMAARKWPKFISATPAESTNSLKGVGGGSIEGSMMRQELVPLERGFDLVEALLRRCV